MSEEKSVATSGPDEKYRKGEKVDVMKEKYSKGGFGEVFLAYVRRNALVVKRLVHNDDESIKKKIKHEIAVNVSIQEKFYANPYIVKYYDVLIPESNPKAYDLLFEYCNRKDVHRYYGSGETVFLKDFCEQCLRGLAMIHELGWVHQDIKPENIMVNVDLHNKVEYKIGDFGEAVEQKITGGELQGITLEYMSVYHYSNNNRYSADIFSFGNVLCWLFTGMSLNEHLFFDEETWRRRKRIAMGLPRLKKENENQVKQKVDDILRQKEVRRQWIDFVKSMFTIDTDGPTAEDLLSALSGLDTISQVLKDSATVELRRHNALRPVDVLQLQTGTFRF